MALATSALQIGRSALLTNQAALQVVGNNVANAANPDYTRQTANLAALPGTPLAPGLQPGAGVTLVELKRNLDEQLEGRLRAALGDNESMVSQQLALGRIEALLNDAGGEGLATQMTNFFNTFSDVQNDPADRGIREVAIAAGEGLASSLRNLHQELAGVGADADAQITTLVEQADQLAEQIAVLNARVVAAEAAGNGEANALRDLRDAALRDLSQLVDVTVRHQSDGSVYVYVGSEPLILAGLSRGLTTRSSSDGQFTRTSVHFADTGSPVQPRSGRLAGLITTRDEHAFGRITAIDEFAAALIHDVNRVHADGQGLIGLSAVTGTYNVDDPTATLSVAGLPFTPRNGSFFIAVTDTGTGTVTAYQIDVDLDGIEPDATLESVVADINANVDGVTAAVSPGGSLSITADTGRTFAFGFDGQSGREDTSGLLAALGINTFFDGSGVADIQVTQSLRDDGSLLAAARVNFAGDGANAGLLAALGNVPSEALRGASISEAYQTIAADLAVTSGAVREAGDVSDTVLASLQSQKESISGVSLDEEAINLLKFERAFQGAARYVATVDRLLTELMSIVR